jgi:membrane protein YqaA with SNARE-associated domain
VLRPIYDWFLRQAASRHAPYVLGLLAFVEAIFLPVPPDVMLAPMVLKRPENLWRYALLTTLCSVAGGCVSYGIGYFFADMVTHSVLWRSHFSLSQYQAFFKHWGVGLILLKGLIPVPYMIITYAAGAAQFSFFAFVLASLATRGGRFCLTAFLAKKYGPQVQERIERNLLLWTSLLAVLAVALVLLIHQIS